MRGVIRWDLHGVVVVMGITGILSYAQASSPKLVLTKKQGFAVIQLSGLEFPEELAKNLTNGLTSRIQVHSTLHKNDEIKGQSEAELALRYDLWEEQFGIEIRRLGSQVEKKWIKTKEEVLSLFQPLRLERVFSDENRGDESFWMVESEVRMNPIEQSRIEEVRQWVNRSRNPSVGGNMGGGIGSLAGGVNASGVLSGLLSFRSSQLKSASWKTVVTSAPFRWKDLPSE